MKPRRPLVDPEPRIITILRTLRDENLRRAGLHLAPGIAEGETDDILDEWQKHENVTDLRRMLGVEKVGRGARRRLSTHARKWGIANAIVNAVWNGSATPLKDVADRLQAGDREVQRAWQEYGDSMLETWRKLLDHPELGKGAQRVIDALKRKGRG